MVRITLLITLSTFSPGMIRKFALTINTTVDVSYNCVGFGRNDILFDSSFNDSVIVSKVDGRCYVTAVVVRIIALEAGS